MYRIVQYALLALTVFTFAFSPPASAGEVPICQLGKAPVKTDRDPTAWEKKNSFYPPEGALVIMHFKYIRNGRHYVEDVLCRMPPDILSYAIDKSTAWDKPSGNNFTPIEWEIPIAEPQAGIHCWDLNGNRINDPNEDINGDGVWDPYDCQGADGERGEDGKDGDPGINCWDFNGNRVNDPDEDFNEDGVWNGLDCVCRMWKTNGPLRKFSWQQCPGQPRERTSASLQWWTKGLIIVGTGATGGALAPLACVAIPVGIGIGAGTGVLVSEAGDIVADALPGGEEPDNKPEDEQ